MSLFLVRLLGEENGEWGVGSNEIGKMMGADHAPVTFFFVTLRASLGRPSPQVIITNHWTNDPPFCFKDR